jgi:hypothetical protein
MAQLWEKLQFWKKQSMIYKESVHFNYLDSPDKTATAIQLLIPNYEGVVYQYHQARIVQEGVLPKLQFGYTILFAGEHDIDDLQNSAEFSTIMGDILAQLIIDKEKYETRNNDTEEPDPL